MFCYRSVTRFLPRCRLPHFKVHTTPRFASIPSNISTPRQFPTSGFYNIELSQKIEEEKFPNYLAERYYPVSIGELFRSRYQVITKLGYGATSTIWLCRDLQENRYLTLKVNVRSKKPNPEVELSKYMASVTEVHGGEKNIRQILDSFDIQGPHGTHCCVLYEPTGIDISTFIHRLESEALPEILLRVTTRVVLIALDYLHQLDIIHTDIQPNNILLGIDDDSVLSDLERCELETPSARKQLPDGRAIYATRSMPITRGEPILSDLGEARRARAEGNQQKNTGLIMPSIYRAPEVMLGMEWDNKVDIWGLAQTVWTLFERGHLFENVNPMGELDNARRFAEMVALMGAPPREFLRRAGEEGQKYWDESGKQSSPE
ncbi:hypothetical protein FQN50_009572 [Emmonsiellopsis sp. PD_5]|nr:hypothetical protein FQN50_009572 [Emmonsiellopsis sp. PD_5]